MNSAGTWLSIEHNSKQTYFLAGKKQKTKKQLRLL